MTEPVGYYMTEHRASMWADWPSRWWLRLSVERLVLRRVQLVLRKLHEVDRFSFPLAASFVTACQRLNSGHTFSIFFSRWRKFMSAFWVFNDISWHFIIVPAFYFESHYEEIWIYRKLASSWCTMIRLSWSNIEMWLGTQNHTSQVIHARTWTSACTTDIGKISEILRSERCKSM